MEEDPPEDETPATLPNPEILSNAHRTVAESHNIQALLVSTFDQMLAALETLKQDIKSLNANIDAEAHNSTARLTNRHSSARRNEILTPIKDRSNRDVTNFPSTDAHIDKIASRPLNTLLQAFNLPTTGGIGERRDRLRMHIGVPVTTSPAES